MDDVAERLRTDFAFYGPTCLKIVATSGKLVPFELKPAQHRLEAAVHAQQAKGKPIRLIVPKARKEGVSTYAVGKLVQRVTQTPNHHAICVAQDSSTAAELLGMAEIMHGNLPESSVFNVKPPIANRRRQKEIVFGNPASRSRAAGDMGINSRLTVDTAGEFEAGRGFTFHSVHASEVGFWPDAKRKLTSLLNAIPDDPSTMAVLESTSNGYNHWRALCYQALNGESDFELVFLSWFDEPGYTQMFLSDAERSEFEESVGTGAYGAEEMDLISVHGCSLEQLRWRRWAIANRCQGDLRVFHQEYPSTLDQSFGATSSGVFNASHILVARRIAEDAPKPVTGTFEAKTTRTIHAKFGTIEIPQDPLWVPSVNGPWRWWPALDKDGQQLRPAGQYVEAVDPAGDEAFDEDSAAMHAAVIIDQQSGAQVAEFEMQGDPDVVAEQAFLAALWFNRAWIAVEVTGGYGLSINRRIHTDFKHPFVYRRRTSDSTRADSDVQHRFGFDTNRATRQMLIDGAIEMLREGSHGIVSMAMMHQFSTFVRDNRGKPVPAKGERSDLLMAWMIAQHVRQVLPMRRDTSGVVSTTGRQVRYKRTGW